MPNNKISIYSKTLNQLEKDFLNFGLKKFNAKQVFNWIYKNDSINFDDMSNIAKSSIEIIKSHYEINTLKTLTTKIDPIDETTKFLFELHDGNSIETVLMKFNYGYSICISTQVGCNMGCEFCASGLLKKKRNLSVDEIVLQYVVVNNFVVKEKNERIGNIVIMGIGEPLDNFENLIDAINILTCHDGLAIGSRHITVSTCGLANKIVEFGKLLPQVNLAISLHASDNETRNKLMPINKVYPIEQLIKSLKEYSKYSNRRLSFEYILFDKINDSTENALALADILEGLICYVNIILYNSVIEKQYKRSSRAKEFCEILNARGITSTIRLERGKNIDAACGQLRVKHEKK